MTAALSAQVVYLLVAVLVFGSAAYYATRNRRPGAGGPGWLTSIAIWIAVLALIVVLYQGAQFWSVIGALVSGR